MNIINLGIQDYLKTLDNMKKFTANRDKNTKDELWIVEHKSVFTQGITSKPEHILTTSDIPIINTDRGGQITYHSLGQLIIYCLIDLKRLRISVKKIIELLQISIIKLLKKYDIEAHLKDKAPGVYINNAKIAALGLKIKNGCTYHGLSLNVNMDLSPFNQINPCGYKELKVIQMKDFIKDIKITKVSQELSKIIIDNVTRN